MLYFPITAKVTDRVGIKPMTFRLTCDCSTDWPDVISLQDIRKKMSLNGAQTEITNQPGNFIIE